MKSIYPANTRDRPVNPVTSHNREAHSAPAACGEAGLHLYARQATAVLDEKVVGMTVAVRPCNPDAFTGCAIREGEFCEFTHSLGAEVARGHIAFLFFKIRPRGAEFLVSASLCGYALRSVDFARDFGTRL